MQPYAFPRWLGFVAALASTAITAILASKKLAPPDGYLFEILTVAQAVLAFVLLFTHSVQGKGGKGTPLLPGGDPGGPSARAFVPLLPLLFLAPLLAACGGPGDRAVEIMLESALPGLVGLVALGGWYLWRASSRRAPAVALLAVVALAACAAPWRGAAIGISTVDRAARKAAIEWEAYDAAHEDAIVDEGRAKNRPADTVRRDVDAWRKTADRVDLAFLALKDASSAAKAGVVMAAQGKASIAGVLSALLDAVRAFLGVLRVAGVKLPAELAALVGGAS